MKNTGRVYLSHVLNGDQLEFESTKTLDDHLDKIDRNDIVYEDDHAVAYLQHESDVGSETHWSLKVAIALKGHVPTLLDLDIVDVRMTAAILRAIQAVAFRFKLYEQGFEIRSDVLPPLQRKGFLEFKVRSGKHRHVSEGTPQPA